MRCSLKIKDIETIHEIDGVWTKKDYIELLDRMSFPEAEEVDPEELLELLFMAMSDLEPNEAAEIMLEYKLSDTLTKGQIQNLAVDMIDNNVAEDYSDIALHYTLFNINQLLNKAFNGKFPNTKASKVILEIKFQQGNNVEIDKEIVLKALCNGLRERNLVRRLFAEQLQGKVEFPEAEDIIWEMEQSEDGTISIITSDYWLNEEDFLDTEFEGTVHEFENE
jgi:hypothetical protein